MPFVWGADALVKPEGHVLGGVIREPLGDPARSKNLGTYGISMCENREIPWLTTGRR